MQYFTIFQDKLHSFYSQNRTKHAWAFSKTVQKISKINHLYDQPVLTFDKRQISSEH